MPILDRNELMAYIAGLKKATEDGKIPWIEVNPTTYSWTSTVAKTNLQRLERAIPPKPPEPGKSEVAVQQETKQVYYNIQVFDPKTNSWVLNLSTTEDQEQNSMLENLYLLIRARISERILNFLRSTLPSE